MSAGVASAVDNVGVVGKAPEGYCRLNGVLWEIPEGWEKETCEEVVMIQADTTGLKTVHVPLFRLEYHNCVLPKLWSDVKGMRLKLNYDDNGELIWFQNLDWGMSRKVHKALKGERKRKFKGKLEKLHEQASAGKKLKKKMRGIEVDVTCPSEVDADEQETM